MVCLPLTCRPLSSSKRAHTRLKHRNRCSMAPADAHCSAPIASVSTDTSTSSRSTPAGKRSVLLHACAGQAAQPLAAGAAGADGCVPRRAVRASAASRQAQSTPLIQPAVPTGPDEARTGSQWLAAALAAAVSLIRASIQVAGCRARRSDGSCCCGTHARARDMPWHTCRSTCWGKVGGAGSCEGSEWPVTTCTL